MGAYVESVSGFFGSIVTFGKYEARQMRLAIGQFLLQANLTHEIPCTLRLYPLT